MAIIIDGKTYRNLQEQVQKNKDDIQDLADSRKVYLHCATLEGEANDYGSWLWVFQQVCF